MTPHSCLLPDATCRIPPALQHLPLPNDGRRSTHHAAAALSSLGLTIKTERIRDYRSGSDSRSFFFGSIAPNSLLALASGLQFIKGPAGDPRHILHLYQAGRIDEIDPEHPFRDALRALHNYEQLRLVLAGRITALALTPDGTNRFRASAGQPVISTPSARTSDPHKAAALLTLGCPLLALDGARMTMGLPHEPLFAPSSLLPAFTNGSILVDHPFVTGWNACRFLDALDEHLNTELGTVNLTRPGHGHRAMVTTNATGSAMDRAIAFAATGR